MTNPAASARVAALHRYPVKGLQGEALTEVALGADGMPCDRVLGLANGSHRVSQFGAWTTYEAFDALSTRPDLGAFGAEVQEGDSRAVVAIQHPDGAVLEVPLDRAGRMGDDGGRDDVVDQWFGSPSTRIDLAASGAHLWDVEDAPVSVLNLATVEALVHAAGRPVDPARFRANVWIEGLPAWAELDLVGRTARLGEAVLEFSTPIDRCNATSVRPGVGGVDLNVPGLLTSRFGHVYCGVYARVLSPGSVCVGDPLVVSPAQPPVPAPPGDDRRSVPRWAQVRAVGRPARHVVDLQLVDSAGALTGARPGQYLRLHHADGTVGWRNYTISAISEEAVRISVRLEEGGRVSPWVHGLNSGARVLVSGPFGDAVLDDEGGPLLLLTAGIGITPALPVLHALARAGSQRTVTSVHVARSSSEVPHWDEVLRDVGRLPNGSAHLFLTAEPPGGDPPSHRTGRPTAAFLRDLLPEATATSVHLCGSPAFTEAVRAVVESAGVPRQAIRFDPFYSPPAGDLTPRPAPSPGPFAVRFPDGREATWSTGAGTVLDLADTSGRRLAASCRSGVCGTCITAVQGDTAYVLDPWVQPGPAEVVLCCAVPTGDIALTNGRVATQHR